MTENRINFPKSSNLTLEIFVKRAPLFIIITLTLVLVILFLIPIVGAVFMVMTDLLNFSLALIIIIFWGSGFYLLRLILWNTCGKEIIIFKPDKVLYIGVYKLFKDGKIEIENKSIEILFPLKPESNQELSYLTIRNESEQIKTVTKLPLETLKEIKERIKTTPNKSS